MLEVFFKGNELLLNQSCLWNLYHNNGAGGAQNSLSQKTYINNNLAAFDLDNFAADLEFFAQMSGFR